MEGSGGDMNVADGKDLSDTNRKRVVKTPFQIEALEKFYVDHNYPTETMKLELGENIGLTEKQVSSWFCHRRLKDKRLLNGEMNANGRKNRSSVAVQNSSGSTKQGDNKFQDPIEIQSTKFNSQQLSAANITVGSHHAGNYSHMHDKSSGSRSSPDKLYPKVDHLCMPASILSAENAVNYVNVGKPRSGPSGYLKVKGRVENPAVTAIKRQLGTHYRNDGPPLGIAFDPLPPGAFEPSAQQPDTTLNSSETYSAEEQVVRLSPVAQGMHQEFLSKPYYIEEENLIHMEDVSRVHKQRIPNIGYGSMSNVSFPKTALYGKDPETIHKPISVQTERFIFKKRKQDFSVSKHIAVDMHEDPPSDIAVYDKRNKYECRPISGAGGSRRGAPAGHDQLEPHGEEVKQEHVHPWLKNSNGRMSKVEQGNSFDPSYSDFMVRRHENDPYGDKGLSRKEAKVVNVYGVAREINDNGDTFQPKIPRKRKMHVAKGEHPRRVRKV